MAGEGSEWRTRRECTDRTTKLEALLPEMLATMVELVPFAKKAREARLEQERVRAEEQRKRWTEQSRRDEERRQMDDLVKAEQDIARSEAALRFLDRIEERLRSDGEISAQVGEWLPQARDIANGSNPLADWIDELSRLEPHGQQNES